MIYDSAYVHCASKLCHIKAGEKLKDISCRAVYRAIFLKKRLRTTGVDKLCSICMVYISGSQWGQLSFPKGRKFRTRLKGGGVVLNYFNNVYPKLFSGRGILKF